MWWCGAVYLSLLLLSVPVVLAIWLIRQALVWSDRSIVDTAIDRFRFRSSLALIAGLMRLGRQASIGGLWQYRCWRLSTVLLLATPFWSSLGTSPDPTRCSHPGARGQTNTHLADAERFSQPLLAMRSCGAPAHDTDWGRHCSFGIDLPARRSTFSWHSYLPNRGAPAGPVSKAISSHANLAWALPSHASAIAAISYHWCLSR